MASTEAPCVDGYDISADARRLDFDAIHAYLSRSYWAARIPRATVVLAARNSVCVGAYDTATGAQVGFARVVTDHATFAYVCDVYVLEGHRGRGIAKAMMWSIMDHPAIGSARRVMLATRDAQGLYGRFGFREAPPDSHLMQIVRPGIYSEVPG